MPHRSRIDHQQQILEGCDFISIYAYDKDNIMLYNVCGCVCARMPRDLQLSPLYPLFHPS